MSASVAGKQSTRMTLRWFNWHVALRAAFDTVCGGTTFLFVAFALSVGVAEASVARFTVAASAGCLFQLIVLPLVAHLSDRKKFIVVLGILEPLVLTACLLMAPHLPPGWRLVALTSAIFIAAAFLHMTRPLIDDWVASAIPGGLRGRYLGRRSQWLTIGTLLSMLVAGWLGDRIGQTNTDGLTILLVIGTGFALASIAALAKADATHTQPLRRFEWSELPAVWRQKDFRMVIVSFGVMQVPFLISIPFYQVFYLKIMNMTPFAIAAMMIGYHIVKIASLGPVGKLVDRIGVRSAMLLAWPFYVTFFVLLSMGNENRWWTVCAAWTLVSLADGLWAVGYPTALYGSVPREGNRPTFFAFANILVFLLYAAGGAIAEPLLRTIKAVEWTIGGSVLPPYQIYFGICGAVCAVTGAGYLLLPRLTARTRIPG